MNEHLEAQKHYEAYTLLDLRGVLTRTISDNLMLSCSNLFTSSTLRAAVERYGCSADIL